MRMYGNIDKCAKRCAALARRCVVSQIRKACMGVKGASGCKMVRGSGGKVWEYCDHVHTSPNTSPHLPSP
jgi:hypothetical protein